MSQSYTKSIAIDFGGSFDAENWRQEVLAAALTPALLDVQHSVGSDDVLTTFDAALAGQDLTDFDALPASHNPVRLHVSLIASAEILADEKQITAGTFMAIAGVVTDPLSPLFGATPSTAKGRFTCQVKTDGTAELMLTEADEDGANEQDMLTVAHAVPDTSGGWRAAQFTTDVNPRAVRSGDLARLYSLKARVVGATYIDIRFGSLILLKVESA